MGVGQPPAHGLVAVGARALGQGDEILQYVVDPRNGLQPEAAALVGEGIVFALALVLPGLVYLRGTCSVYLAMCRDDESGR